MPLLFGAIKPDDFSSPHNQEYQYTIEPIHIAIKVETHNHPTGISPHQVLLPAQGVRVVMKGRQEEAESPKRVYVAFLFPIYISQTIRFRGRENPHTPIEWPHHWRL